MVMLSFHLPSTSTGSRLVSETDPVAWATRGARKKPRSERARSRSLRGMVGDAITSRPVTGRGSVLPLGLAEELVDRELHVSEGLGPHHVAALRGQRQQVAVR